MRSFKQGFCWFCCLLCFSLSSQLFAEENKYTTEDVEKFVAEAKSFAVANGKDAALKAFMDQDNKQFRRGSLYVFAQDFTGMNLAHIKSTIVGTNMIELKDPNGVTFIKNMGELAKSTPNGGWTEYMWQNPMTKQLEKKYTFVVSVDSNWWIGAGFYESEKK